MPAATPARSARGTMPRREGQGLSRSQMTVLLAGEREGRDCGIVREYCLLAFTSGREEPRLRSAKAFRYRGCWLLPMDGLGPSRLAARAGGSLMAAVTSEGSSPGAGTDQLAERLRAARAGTWRGGEARTTCWRPCLTWVCASAARALYWVRRPAGIAALITAHVCRPIGGVNTGVPGVTQARRRRRPLRAPARTMCWLGILGVGMGDLDARRELLGRLGDPARWGCPVRNNGDTAYPKPAPSMSAAGVMSGRRSMRNELPRPRREAMAGTSSAI